jgi:iron(III) transport system substrate-binding protein
MTGATRDDMLIPSAAALSRSIRMISTMLCVLWFTIGCDQSGTDGVVVYVSADEQVARPILQAFTERTGIPVSPLFDTEATKTTGLANRLRRESERPRADLFWSSEPFEVERLAAEGLLAPANHPALAGHPTAWRRADGRWFAFAARGRVIVYDPEVLAPEDAPDRWTALIDPRFRDAIVMADPRFGTTRGHLGAMSAYWSRTAMPGYYAAWLEGLAENGIRMLPGGNAATVDAVARGEAILGLTDTDDVSAARARGLRVSAIKPRHGLEREAGGGTMLIPNAAGIVSNGPNPAGAVELLAFLASAEVEARLYASPSRNIPIAHPELSIDPSDRIDEPLDVGIAETAALMDAAVAQAMSQLDPERIRRLREPGPGRSLNGAEVIEETIE